MYIWEHGGFDKKGNPKPKLYNVLINGVVMEKLDNKLVYKHNRYNLAKSIFERTSDTQFYWGNSMPNKIRQHQEYKDAWRSIVLNKAILNLLPPLLNKSGENFDDAIVPGKIIPTNSEKGDVFKIEGVGEPITASDLNIDAMIDREVDQGTSAPQSAGLAGQEAKTTLGELQMREARASELMELFGQAISNLAEDLAELSIPNIIQFMLKDNVSRIVDGGKLLSKKNIQIPEQKLEGGEIGTMDLTFMASEQQPSSREVLEKEEKEFEDTGVRKEMIFIDPKIINDYKFFFYTSANPATKPSEATERLIAVENYTQVYFNNPLIDQREALRTIIRVNKDDETRLLLKNQPLPEMQPQSASAGLTSPSTKLKQSVKPKVPQQANV